jgi:protein-disulfide isomerase
MVGFLCVESPRLLVAWYSSSMRSSNPHVEAWRTAPFTTFNLKTSQGTFGDYHKGVPNAPIQIVEFADFECPACKMVSRVVKGALEKYEGRYFFVFKNYPLDKSCNPNMTRELHQYACVAAHFARCAGEQGKFWEASDLLFLREADSGELTTRSLVEEASKELSIDEEAVGSCMNSKRYESVVLDDIQEGERVGLQGTPSIWVNGRFVENPSAETLDAIFKRIVSRQ